MATQPSTLPPPVRNGSRVITYVWLALTALTVLAWWLAPGHSGAPAAASIPITVTVLVVALTKSRLIIRYFMEVRNAPTWLKRVTDTWLVILFGSILAIYLF
jgi:hypothetical protein